MTSYGTDPIPLAPYSVDLLADLHAGVLSDAVSEQLWPLVRQDADAMEVISALDAVSARLAAESVTPSSAESIPPEVAERIDRALATAALPEAVHSPEAPASVTLIPRRYLTRKAIAVGVAAAVGIAAAAMVATVVVSAVTSGIGTNESSDDVRADAPTLILDSEDLDASLAFDVMATGGTADMFDSGNVSECLAANGFQPGSGVLGAAPIELDGRSGFVLVIAKDLPDAGMTLLAVSPDCGTDNPGTLARTDVG